MRAVTLSDKSVRKLIRSRFVCAHTDLEGDASAGESLRHEPGDPAGNCVRGNGEHNMQILWLTPDGRLLHVVAGYLDPADMLVELRFVEKLWRDVSDLDVEAVRKAISSAHARRLEQLEQSEIEGPFARFERIRRKQDHRFASKHALEPSSRFRTAALVGNGKTFFGSSTGSKPRERIGKAPESDPKQRP